MTGDTAQTDDAGQYTLSVADGEATITATAVGYESVTQRLRPGDTGDLSFETEIRPAIQRASPVPSHVTPGESVTLEFDVEHAEFATIFGGDSPYLIEKSALSVRINGAPATVGEPTNIVDASRLRIELAIEDGARGLLPLSIGLAAGEANAGIDLDPIHVHQQPLAVAADEDVQRAIHVAAPETTVALAGDRWEIAAEGFDPPLPDPAYNNPVLQQTRDDKAGLVVEKPITLTAAEGHDPTLVVTGDTGARTFGVQIATHFATFEGIEVVAEGATATVSVIGSDGVHLENLTLSGATNGVFAQFTKSLVVSECDISAGDTAVALRDLSVHGLVQNTTLRDAQRGVFLSGRVGERLFDVDATVSGNTFENVATDIDTEGTARLTGEDADGVVTGTEPPTGSPLDLLLYAATATAVGGLFVPYARRRLGGKR